MQFSRNQILIFSLAVVAIIAGTLLWLNMNKAPQQAQQFYIHDEESFKANTKSYHEIPFSDPRFEFDILLPKDWTAERLAKGDSLAPNQAIPENITRYKSPMIGTAQATVTVQAMHLDREISAENWLKNYVLTNGYSVQEKIAPLGSKRAGVAYISTFETTSSYTYTAVQINADTIMLARFEIPLWLKDPLGFVQKKTIDSFRMLLTTDAPVETQKPFALADAAGFSYPESWMLRYSTLDNPNNLSAQIYSESPNKKVEGLISFMAIRRTPATSFENEIKNLKNYFETTVDIKFKKLLSSDKAPASGRFLFSRYETYLTGSIKGNAADRELRLAALGDKDWYIFVFLLTPPESDNFYTWASNVATFDLIVKSLR
ncbi:MAG: hypothetical protein K8R48_07770 [Alphaproteobacteria bacterium]|nr:hypothetical protein [Alphaproteobacteria bacterium]